MKMQKSPLYGLLVLLALILDSNHCHGQSIDRVTYPSYIFTLKKSLRNTVCQAYLERLNKTTFEKPPYCGRPENGSVAGFSVLRRIPLSSIEVDTLYQRVSQFFAHGEQGTKAKDEAEREAFRRNGLSGPFESNENINQWLSMGEIAAWYYDPAVDLQNGRKPPAKLVIWQGMPLPAMLGVCGKPVTAETYDSDLEPQQGIYLAPSDDKIDARMTKDVFFNITTIDGQSLHRNLPFGLSVGVFRYHEKYYWDTFLPSSKNRSEAKSKIGNLGVFEYDGRSSSQICEYSMNTTWSPVPKGAVDGGKN